MTLCTARIGSSFSPCPLATSGSDSPGQAVEAEEIVKQLDMEQLEETPTSTTIDGCRDITFDPALNSRPLLPTETTVEEGEIASEADMPPLTGERLEIIRGVFYKPKSIPVLGPHVSVSSV